MIATSAIGAALLILGSMGVILVVCLAAWLFD